MHYAQHMTEAPYGITLPEIIGRNLSNLSDPSLCDSKYNAVPINPAAL
jgi:hypothetical protein